MERGGGDNDSWDFSDCNWFKLTIISWIGLQRESIFLVLCLGCEIKYKPNFRERTRSGRLSRKQGTGSRPSIIDWPMGKFSWLKDRKTSSVKNPGRDCFTSKPVVK